MDLRLKMEIESLQIKFEKNLTKQQHKILGLEDFIQKMKKNETDLNLEKNFTTYIQNEIKIQEEFCERFLEIEVSINEMNNEIKEESDLNLINQKKISNFDNETKNQRKLYLQKIFKLEDFIKEIKKEKNEERIRKKVQFKYR